MNKQYLRAMFLPTFVLAFSIAFLLTGCKKDDNPLAATGDKPAVPSLTFKGPNTTSTDPMALTAKSFALQMNALSSPFAGIQDNPGTLNGNVWSYENTADGLTTKWTATINGDKSVTWQCILNGKKASIPSSSNYNNWLAFEANSSVDGKSGYWKIYNENATTLAVQYTWSTAADVTISATIDVYDTGAKLQTVEMTNKIDGSGTMKNYAKKSAGTAFYLQLDLLWKADGTGSYTTYQEDGTVLGTGTF
jgi:hypothetical protein